MWAFNFHQSLSLDDIVAATAVNTTRAAKLMVSNQALTIISDMVDNQSKMVDAGLFVSAEGVFTLNDGFKTKKKRLVIACE